MANTQDYWAGKLAKYAQQDWAKKTSLFAEQAIDYFPPSGALLELGAGLGKDSEWFAAKGYEVTATDQVGLPELQGVNTQLVDLAKPLPFGPASFDIVYSHLALHYFPLQRTEELFAEIYEILKPGGIFAFLVNSVHDPEVDEGEEIETNFRRVGGIEKRYFDVEITHQLTQPYKVLLLDDKGSSHKDQAKGVANLIRFIGQKT